MKLPAAAVRPLVALAIVAASIGCIAPLPAYAENATAAVAPLTATTSSSMST